MSISLTQRLSKAATLVGLTRSGEAASPNDITVADIGCDHGYLSLYLVLNGKCARSIASDLREGPLNSARANIRKFGCEKSIVTVLTDGLTGIHQYQPTDILICGMGGDTIIQILSAADFIRQKGLRLILQPQTAFAELALYLSDNGFQIHAERYAHDNNKAYRIIAAEYVGECEVLSVFDALIGRPSFEEDRNSYRYFCQKMLSKVEKKINGSQIHKDAPQALLVLRDEILQSMRT